MPHAALWVVQPTVEDELYDLHGFNAARGFVGGAATKRKRVRLVEKVSMPHAALWVVQLRRSQFLSP